MTGLVVGLGAIDPRHPDTLDRVGGKAANLAVLVRAGFPVPGGLVVTTAAYRLAVGDIVDPLLDALAAAVPDEVPALAAKARDLVAAVPVPEEVDRALRAALPDGPVAVRSSATAEDLPDGQLRRPAGHVPQRRRHRGRAGRRAPLLGVAVDRPRGQPTARRRASRTTRSRSP